MLQEKLGLDDKDVLLLTQVMHNPSASQADLAGLVKLSQPSVNARLHKLKEKGLLAAQYGIDAAKADMILARVDFTAAHAQDLLNKLARCSFFVNGFVMSGKTNVSIIVVGHDLRKIESIVDKHLRANKDVKDIEFSVIVSTAKPFVCTIDLEKERHEACQHNGSCEGCAHLKM